MTTKKTEGGWTPGPWRWFGNAKSNNIYLATTHSGHRWVMGFKRWGMSGAQPQFQPESRGLVDASALLKFEVGKRAIRGIKAAGQDSSVYRYDISDIDCPDAHLISQAPTMAEYIRRRAEAGDPEAVQLWEMICG